MKRKVIRTNSLANMTKEDWKEANEVTKQNRGLSSLTFEDIYGENTSEIGEQLSKDSQQD